MFIKGYSDLKLRIPDCHSESDLWAAELKLNASNISSIFPYVNAQNEQARYFENPHYIQFVINEKRCALYEDKVIIAPFKDRESVVEFINILMNYLNNLYENKDSILPNNKKYSNIPVLEIFKMLPRTNCKKCGFQSCMAFAASLGRRETQVSLCPDLYKSLQENTNQDISTVSGELRILSPI
jgi:ArsR family metal-binding transcriptional regulator